MFTEGFDSYICYQQQNSCTYMRNSAEIALIHVSTIDFQQVFLRNKTDDLEIVVYL